MSTAARGLRLSVGTLTRVPVGEVGTPTRTEGGWSMVLAPVAALPLAVGAGLVTAAGHTLALPPLVVGLLVVALLAWGTRGMHLDGLADTVDGLGGGWDRDRALAIMRSGDVGPMGTAALVLVLGLQAAAAGGLGAVEVAGAVVLSRAACTVLAFRTFPAARPGGLGALVAGTVGVPALVAVLTAATVALGVVLLLTGWGDAAALAAPACTAALVVTSLAVAQGAWRAVGGVTGDHFGAAVELSLAAVLVVLSAGVWA